jgi:hypothetical protein
MLTALDATTFVQLLASRAGASPAGVAVVEVNGSPDPTLPVHISFFGVDGTPVATVDRDGSTSAFEMLTRDVVLVEQGTVGTEKVLLRADGTTRSLGNGTVLAVPPNGDVVTNALPPSGPNTVTRLHPDGTVVWQTSMGADVLAVETDNEHVAVTMAKALTIIDAAGAVVAWTPGPQADFLPPRVPRAVLSPSGGFYVVDQPIMNLLRVYRAGADGVTLWRETYDDTPGLTFPSPVTPAPSIDERLLLPVVAGTSVLLRVFDP